MGKFNKTGKREMPALNTSSLPDLIFTLLFFFMIVTTMREVTLKVQFTLPQGTELEKLEKKSLVTFIYVGEPTQEYRAKMGTESRIQLNDSYAEVSEVQDFIFQERASMSEGDAAKMTVSLKVDQKTKMGIITDIKEVLHTDSLYNALIYQLLMHIAGGDEKITGSYGVCASCGNTFFREFKHKKYCKDCDKPSERVKACRAKKRKEAANAQETHP